MNSCVHKILDRSRTRNIIFGITFTMALVYFFQITLVSARGYELKKLADQKINLAGETGRIELFIAEESSAQNLQKRVAALGLGAPQKVEYIRFEGNSVAVK